MDAALILVRGIHFAATILAAGTVFFAVLVAGPVLVRTRDRAALARQWRWFVWASLVVAVTSGALWLVLVAADIYGAPIADVCIHGGAWTVATNTRFGLVALIRLATAATLALAMFWTARDRNADVLRLLLAASFLVSLAFVGHAGAAAEPGADMHFVSDIVHLLVAGFWLGSLPAFALLLLCSKTGAMTVTPRFAKVALVSVLAIAATGAINTWHALGDAAELFTTDYGRLISLKVGLFAAMLCVAAVNRFYLTPRLKRGSASTLARNCLAEAALGFCVLILVGALGTLPPPGHAHAHTSPGAIPQDAAFVHIHTNELMAEVTIVPAANGGQANIRLLRGDFSPYPARRVSLTLVTPSGQGHAYAAQPAGNVWQANAITLSESGRWLVNVTVTTGAGTSIVLDAPIALGR